MTITITAIGKKDTNGNGSDNYIWSFSNSGAVDVTYTWTSGAESGSITLLAGTETLLSTITFENIILQDGLTTIATGVYDDIPAPATHNTGAGDQAVQGHEENNNINTQGGHDSVTTGAGEDTIAGGGGRDTIDSGDGDDNINAGGDADVVNTGNGADVIVAGNGNDSITGGAGADTITGGGGRDDFIYTSFTDSTVASSDLITDFDTVRDELDLSALGITGMGVGATNVTVTNDGSSTFIDHNSSDFRVTLDGVIALTDLNFIFATGGGTPTSGDDNLIGTAGVDNINALSGNDTIDGLGGDDYIRGRQGNDIIHGGEGDDEVLGNNDNDTIYGDNGNDYMRGGNGDDVIYGGAGNDTFRGDGGNDTIVIEVHAGDSDVILANQLNGAGDMVDVTAFGGGLYWDDIATQNGNHVEIDLGGQTLTVYDTTIETLSPDKFDGIEAGTNPEVPGELIEGATSNIADSHRVTSVDVANVMIDDWNGDGVNDIISSNGGTYGAGVIWIDGTNEEVNRFSYTNGTHEKIIDFNGDGIMDIVTNVRGGLGYLDGSIDTSADGDGDGENDDNFVRITYNDAGDFRVGDMDGDGNLDVLGNMGAYGSGVAIQGAVWYDAAGTMTRLTYNDLGDGYEIADIDDDGAAEVLSNNGSYQNGIEITGLTYYELDGSLTRHTFAADGGFQVGNFDAAGDAGLEVLAIDAEYNSGAIANGGTVFNGNHDITRFTYNNLGDFDFGDVDGDGMTDVVSANGTYQNGSSVLGVMRYGVDGEEERILYNDVDGVIVADWTNNGTDDILVTGGVFGAGLVRLEMGVGNNDILVGTENNDTIIGGNGNDTLTGGQGNDIFRFIENFDDDTIIDFREGNSTLEFDSVIGINDANDVLAASVVSGGNTVISVGVQGSITLENVTDLSTDDIVIL